MQSYRTSRAGDLHSLEHVFPVRNFILVMVLNLILLFFYFYFFIISWKLGVEDTFKIHFLKLSH